MSQDETRISEKEARALWRRAAELQAEAARRLEERSRQLAPRGQPADMGEVEGYRLADVRAAAEEAGISPEFVDHALVESRNRGLAEGTQAQPSAMAARFLGQPPLTLEVSRVIHAPAEEVYAAMQRILPGRPFRLSLTDHYGADPLDGGVLAFNVPAFSYTATTTDQSFAYEMAWADLKQLLFSLRRLDTDPPATELTVQASLVRSQKLSMWVGGGISGVVASLSGVVGGFAGGAVGTALGIGGFAAGTAVAGFLAGGCAVGGLAMLGWRGVYRYALRRGEKAIRNLIGSIAVDIETGGGFSSPKPLPSALSGFLGEGPEA
ncbi:MAG: hypothetical protein OXH51_03645 [Gemmatimonadetes bacterium]|nr:hypothetical protein [Gemmatimonadota bacterium]MCY3610605.1 hypothetical protein [Gemmatimonadota bacterium]